MSPAASRIIIDGATIATVDAAGTEHPFGHVVIDDATIVAVGAGKPPAWALAGQSPSGGRIDPLPRLELVDGTGHLVTPGLINTHHHLYQWLTRGWAQDAILFDWLVALYPAWSLIDADLVEAGAEAAIAVLARSGCTTVADHHYVFPAGSGDILGGIVAAAGRVGVRLHATRGSMDLGRSQGGTSPGLRCGDHSTRPAGQRRCRRAVPRPVPRIICAGRPRPVLTLFGHAGTAE